MKNSKGPNAPVIEKKSFDFLKKLSKNNNREWFAKHKQNYSDCHENIVAFAEQLLHYMNMHDVIETPSGKKSLFRIYRDIRFSKDKTPYHTYWSGYFKRATKKRRGSYYYHLEPGNSFIAAGFWGPNPHDLLRIRKEIHLNPEGWEEIMMHETFLKKIGGLQGDQLKSAPRGFDKDDPQIKWLRYTQFLVKSSFTDKEVLSPGFARKVSGSFEKMRPFLDFMSEVLTTSADGESLLDE